MADTIKLGKFTQLSYFGIYEPRYHDSKVLLAAHKVGTHNKVVFLKAPSMGTEPYYISGKVVRKYPKTTNGAISCFVVPLDELRPLEINIKDWR